MNKMKMERCELKGCADASLNSINNELEKLISGLPELMNNLNLQSTTKGYTICMEFNDTTPKAMYSESSGVYYQFPVVCNATMKFPNGEFSGYYLELMPISVDEIPEEDESKNCKFCGDPDCNETPARDLKDKITKGLKEGAEGRVHDLGDFSKHTAPCYDSTPFSRCPCFNPKSNGMGVEKFVDCNGRKASYISVDRGFIGQPVMGKFPGERSWTTGYLLKINDERTWVEMLVLTDPNFNKAEVRSFNMCLPWIMESAIMPYHIQAHSDWIIVEEADINE